MVVDKRPAEDKLFRSLLTERKAWINNRTRGPRMRQKAGGHVNYSGWKKQGSEARWWSPAGSETHFIAVFSAWAFLMPWTWVSRILETWIKYFFIKYVQGFSVRVCTDIHASLVYLISSSQLMRSVLLSHFTWRNCEAVRLVNCAKVRAGIWTQYGWLWASQWALVVKNPSARAEDTGDVSSIPGLGRSPGGGHGNPLQYSCLGNPMDRGAWQAAVHGATKSQTCPRD